MEFRARGLELDGFAERISRSAGLAGGIQSVTKGAVRFGILRSEADRFARFLQGALCVLLLNQRVGQIDVCLNKFRV